MLVSSFKKLSQTFLILFLLISLGYADLGEWFEENKDEEFNYEPIGNFDTNSSSNTGSWIGFLFLIIVLVVIISFSKNNNNNENSIKETEKIKKKEFQIIIKDDKKKVIETFETESLQEAKSKKDTLEKYYKDLGKIVEIGIIDK